MRVYFYDSLESLNFPLRSGLGFTPRTFSAGGLRHSVALISNPDSVIASPLSTGYWFTKSRGLMTSFKRSISVFSSCFSVLLISACGGGGGGESSRQNLSLNFRAQDGQVPVSCGSILSGLGPDRQDSVSLNDLRFYISNVHFFDAQGQELISEAIPSEFQLIDSDGAVGLIDLTNNSDGACSSVNFAGAEGTQRTNASLTFSVESGQVATVRFDVGVPQRLMKKVLNTFTTEGAPSPLGEMYWTWASGYRHLVMNFLIQGGRGSIGEGYLHLGSRDCG